jgi:hypothetical protein
VLTLLSAALTAALMAICWRMHRRHAAELAARRLVEAALVRDRIALEARTKATLQARFDETAVLASADAIITHALTQHSTQHGSGDPA